MLQSDSDDVPGVDLVGSDLETQEVTASASVGIDKAIAVHSAEG